MDLSKIDGRVLTSGKHESPDDGMCIMEALSYAMGESFTDFPSCTPREVARLAQRINDGWCGSDAERTETLAPLIPMLASCERSTEASRVRAFLCADRARLWAADAIELRGFKVHAERIRGLPVIASHDLAIRARDVIRAIRAELRTVAYADAADAAAYADAADAAAYADAADAAAYADAAAATAAADAAAYAAYAAYAAADAAADAAAYADADAAAADDARIKRRSERIELLIAMCEVRTK